MPTYLAIAEDLLDERKLVSAYLTAFDIIRREDSPEKAAREALHGEGKAPIRVIDLDTGEISRFKVETTTTTTVTPI